MDILKLYETASEKMEQALKITYEPDLKISSLTMIVNTKDEIFFGFNTIKINDSLKTESVSSDYIALMEYLSSKETSIDALIKINSETLSPVDPDDNFLELILKLNLANKSANVVTGKDSCKILSTFNDKITDLVENMEKELLLSKTEDMSIDTSILDIEMKREKDKAKDIQMSDAEDNEETNNTTNNEIKILDSDASQNDSNKTNFDTAGLKMIFDDWESTAAPEQADVTNMQSKPFNAASLETKTDTATEPKPNNNTYQQQQMSGMYHQQQPMMNNGMYQQQQPMNDAMYQQQPMMNGMYQQQPMNDAMYQQQQPMNGMYQQQPMMNGMYHQQQPMMNGMYQQQQPMMNGMYQQQQPMMNGMYQQQNQSIMYQGNQQPFQQQNSMYINGMQPQVHNTNNINNTNTAPASKASTVNTQQMSVYGSNINAGDNNAIFKDRLNDILGVGKNDSSDDEAQLEDALQSAKDRKKAAKIDAKFLKKQKRNNNL